MWTQWDAEKQQLTLIKEMGSLVMLEEKNYFQITNFKIVIRVKEFPL